MSRRVAYWFIISGTTAFGILGVASCAAPQPTPSVVLEELLAQGKYQEVLDHSVPIVRAARRHSDATAWPLERSRLVALARLGEVERLVNEWQVTRVRYARFLPPSFDQELATELLEADPSRQASIRFLFLSMGMGEPSPDILECVRLETDVAERDR
jgi:hypothetical protein